MIYKLASYKVKSDKKNNTAQQSSLLGTPKRDALAGFATGGLSAALLGAKKKEELVRIALKGGRRGLLIGGALFLLDTTHSKLQSLFKQDKK